MLVWCMDPSKPPPVFQCPRKSLKLTLSLEFSKNVTYSDNSRVTPKHRNTQWPRK
ncbi:hypothetical protein T4D_4676 [Trichinella pseudospiralis]|uniref:Uncharacterized protein n=1 Tax=Trichinella pseudospiralis TaxID=6337 RepID=A0A0V1EEJ0_TRIPS|nr:hypothetical protein T4D_4676 [Trichinella pseudospiralis]